MVRCQDDLGSCEPKPVVPASRGSGHLRADCCGQAVLLCDRQRASSRNGEEEGECLLVGGAVV